MTHSVPRLLASLYGKPHLIDKRGFQAITSYLRSRPEAIAQIPVEQEEEDKPLSFDSVLGIGVITVHGPLSYRKTGWEAMCGGFSYQQLLEETEEMLVAGVRTIVMDCDSGGGEAFAMMDTADQFRALLDDYGAKAYAFVDGSACSAMYGIAVACDEVICHPDGEAGSIGVLVALCNDSEALKMEGYERIFITEGAQKVPFADDGSFRTEFLDDIQMKVSALGAKFRAHVSKYTGISEQAIKDMEARVFMAEDALSLGLVNRIATRPEFMQYVVQKHKENMNA